MKKFIENIDRRVLTEDEIKMMNGLKLAYIGDGVYELYIRTYVLNNYRGSVNELNKKSIFFVKAASQAKIINYLKPFLSDFEWAIVTRGRNQKSSTVPKNAKVGDYKMATGFEALIGSLYLKGEEDRLREIIINGIKFLDPEEENE